MVVAEKSTSKACRWYCVRKRKKFVSPEWDRHKKGYWNQGTQKNNWFIIFDLPSEFEVDLKGNNEGRILSI